MVQIRPHLSGLAGMPNTSIAPKGVRARAESFFAQPWAIRLLLPLLVATVGVTILAIGDGILRRGLDAMAQSRFADQSGHLSDHLRLSIDRAQARLDGMVTVITEQGVTVSDAQVARAMRSAMEGNPAISWLSVSTPDGIFRGLSRESGSFIFSVSQPGVIPGSEGSESLRPVSEQGELGAATTRATRYDPRTRPFYTLALAKGQRTWTEPYTFFSTNSTGITCCQPLYAADGALLAVLSLDFDSGSLGTTMSQLSTIAGSRSFIFAADGTVLGATGESLAGRSGSRVVNVLDLQDATLLNLVQRVRDGSLNVDDPTVRAGGDIRAAIRRLSITDGPKLLVVSYAPESEILGAASSLRARGLWIAVLAIAGAAGVGLLIAAALDKARRERSEAREAARQAQAVANELGSYRLVSKLGEGGMGEVWRAEHRQLARPAAIKLMRNLGTGTEFATRFEREAKVIASLRSRNTIGLYDYGVADDGALYYVMELLDGLDLEHLVANYGAVSPQRAMAILHQACLSLAEAHDHGLVHRDIKPANIYLCRLADEVDVVKVLDFGLVLSVQPDASDTRLSLPGTVFGTPTCMAPEQARGHEVDGRTDLYALGCVMWWLLAGELPFSAPDAMGLMLAHVNEAPRLLAEVKPGLPPDLVALVADLLAKDPAARPADAREVIRRLRVIDTAASDLWDDDIAAVWWQKHLPMVSGDSSARRSALSDGRTVELLPTKTAVADSMALPGV